MSDIKIYENNIIVDTIASMVRNQKVVNSLFIYGEKGLGKKTMAKYIAASIICEEQTGKACHACRTCRMVFNDVHPDVITMVPEGNNKNFLIDQLRDSLITDAPIAPSEAVKKVYILPDMDATLTAAQNALLKLVEEPPDNCVIIFTGSSRASLIPTILSRVIPLGIQKLSDNSIREILKEKGYGEIDIESAINTFNGNIGKCIGFLENENGICDIITTTKAITDAIILADEYLITKEIFELSNQKQMALSVFDYLLEVIRDASVYHISKDEKLLTSVYKDGAIKLSETMTKKKTLRIYDAITNASSKILANGNLNLNLTALSSNLLVWLTYIFKIERK